MLSIFNSKRDINKFKPEEISLCKNTVVMGDHSTKNYSADILHCLYYSRHALCDDSRTSRAIIQKERDIRQERIAQLSREFEQVLDQMQQAHEEAVAVNKQNERLMKLITEYISDRQVC